MESASGDVPVRGATVLAEGVNRKLILILALGAAVRVGLLAWFDEQPIRIWDEKEYSALALNLMARAEFALSPGQPTSLRPPLYPAIVAAVYRVFGPENWQAVRALQLIASLITVAVVFQLGVALYNARVGLWSAGFLCFYPTYVGYANLVLTEVLFVLLLCLFCLFFCRALRLLSLPQLALAGFLLGLSALVRSVLWLLPPLLAFLLLWAWRDGRSRHAALLFLLAFGTTILPWALRNSRLQHTVVVVDVMGGRNFMMGNYEHTPLFRSWDAIGLRGEQSWFQVLLSKYPEAGDATQGQIDKLALRAGIDFVVSHPWLTVRRSLVKFFNFWQLERELVAGGALGYFGPVPRSVTVLFAVLSAGSYAGLLWLAIFGAFLAPPADRRFHVFMLLLVAFQCLIHAAVFAHSRYHLPTVPILACYASGALAWSRDIWRRRRSARFIAAVSCCVVFALGWAVEVLVVDLSRVLRLLTGS